MLFDLTGHYVDISSQEHVWFFWLDLNYPILEAKLYISFLSHSALSTVLVA